MPRMQRGTRPQPARAPEDLLQRPVSHARQSTAATPGPEGAHAGAHRPATGRRSGSEAVTFRESLTKRALERQFRRVGLTRRTAETEVARLTQAERWRRLTLKERSEIAWAVLTRRAQR